MWEDLLQNVWKKWLGKTLKDADSLVLIPPPPTPCLTAQVMIPDVQKLINQSGNVSIDIFNTRLIKPPTSVLVFPLKVDHMRGSMSGEPIVCYLRAVLPKCGRDASLLRLRTLYHLHGGMNITKWLLRRGMRFCGLTILTQVV